MSQSLQKKITLPVGIKVAPELLGTSHEILMRSDLYATLHFPKSAKKNNDIGISAPLMPPVPYEIGTLKKNDANVEFTWLQWGSNNTIVNNELQSAEVCAFILTFEGEYYTVDNASIALSRLEDYILSWYVIFGEWVELLTQQDLNETGLDSIISHDNVQDNYWSIKTNNDWISVTPNVTKLTTNLQTNYIPLTEKSLKLAINYSNTSQNVSYENKILIDARRRLHREDYSTSCLYFGQYIEATARKRIREYLELKGTDTQIIDEFLEKRALNDLLGTCKSFSLDMNLSSREKEAIGKLRNNAAHARGQLSHSDALRSQKLADKVYSVNS